MTERLYEAARVLTTITDSFFREAITASPMRGLEAYLPAMRIASRFGISPEQVEDLVIEYTHSTVVRSAPR